MMVKKVKVLCPFSQIADKLLKLSTAERAQLRNVLLHAFRDLFDVRNELPTESHGVLSAGATLFWRSRRETGGRSSGYCEETGKPENPRAFLSFHRASPKVCNAGLPA